MNQYIEPISSYPGCKAWCANEILDTMPPGMDTHVEPFSGVSKSLLISPCKKRVYNDASKGLYCLASCLSDPELGQKTLEIALQIPYSQESFKDAKKVAESCNGKVNPYVAACVWVTLLQSKNGDRGIFKGFSNGVELEHYQSVLLRKSMCLDFMRGVKCFNRDALDIISQYRNQASCFMVIDPPYYGIKGLYEKEFFDYTRLCHVLLGSTANIILFDYENPYYNNILLADSRWHRTKFLDTVRRMRIGGRGERRSTVSEVIWHNFTLPYKRISLTGDKYGGIITAEKDVMEGERHV